ncbi:hypothetical protein ACHQM5_030542 [Ranunculus cassubicifolius]
MGKPCAKKNKKAGKSRVGKANSNPIAKGLDKDMEVFIAMSHELKEEGNKLFQKRDHEGAMLKYEKALNLLPMNTKSCCSSVDVAYLRTNMAACYMQMGLGEYPRAIQQCDLAIQACNGHVKALIKRAKCYHALERIDSALRDVNLVLKSQPNNLVALELAEILKQQVSASKSSRKKSKNVASSTISKEKEETKMAMAKMELDTASEVSEEAAVDSNTSVKLVFGEDIRWAQLPVDCSVMQLREVVQDRFDCAGKTLLIKYKDQEGDLITITSDEELRWAKQVPPSNGNQLGIGSVRLYVFEANNANISQEQKDIGVDQKHHKHNSFSENGNIVHVAEVQKEESSCFVDDWIVHFARVFKTHVGFESDEYLNLHERTMELHSHAMEETTTTEEAQPVLEVAANNFQEMAALAMFHWGNVHMSRARKKPGFITDDAVEDNASKESLAKSAYEWAKKEYVKAGMRYEGALSIKPEFYEAYLAMAQQQFEEAKLSWCYAIGCGIDLETWPSTAVLQLFNSAEDSMEKGIQVWEDVEKQRLNQLSKQEILSGEMGVEQSTYMRSHINLLWGIILYERSVVEFKLGIPVWNECLEVAVEKFQLAGVSATDVAVTIKNHCANQAAGEGLGFKVDEIVQAWNEMHDAKHWKIGVPSVRLEPLFRRRVPKLHHDLEYL